MYKKNTEKNSEKSEKEFFFLNNLNIEIRHYI